MCYSAQGGGQASVSDGRLKLMKPSSAVEGEQGWPGKEGEGNGGGKEVGPQSPPRPMPWKLGHAGGPGGMRFHKG